MSDFAGFFIKVCFIVLFFSVFVSPEETGKLWRAKYNSFLIGWNGK